MIPNTDIYHAVKKHGAPLLITDCDSIRAQYHALQNALPNVKLYYAMKPFPHKTVVDVLHKEGSYFDVATTGEIQVLKKLNIGAEKCIHTHPIKRIKDIRAAINYGITQFVADNPDEILKFKKFKTKAKLLLRISFRSPSASIDLSKKFGCAVNDVISLLELARNNGIRINGFSFHVGSQSRDSSMYVTAVKTCNELIAECVLRGLPAIEILDIGGGFPIDYDGETATNIYDFCKPITEELKKLPTHISIVAEPGRFIVGPSTISVSTIMGKAKREDKIWYYLDDGIYGSYSNQFFDHVQNPVHTLYDDIPLHTYPSVLSGPTCDSIDVVKECIQLPELNIGDLIIGRVMGAYTWATSTNFNFFDKAKFVFLNYNK
jgi:ornithine decarboxylase